MVLVSVVAALSLLVKRNSSSKDGRVGPSDKTLLRLVVADCILGPQHCFAVMEYLTKPEECIAGISFATCILRVYWPTTHISFLCKWTGSGYPPRVVFAPELFRNLGFFCVAVGAVASRDGSATAASPAFLVPLALRTAASFMFTMLAVTVTTAPLHVAVIENALPPGLLDATCPRLLHGARDMACSAMLAICAALRLQPQRLGNIAGLASGAGSDFTKSEAVLPGASFTGVAALSVVINIINADVSLHAIGRMQGLLTVAVIVLMLSSPHGASEPALPPSAAENLDDTEHLHLSWDDVVRGKVLGSGGFGSVYAARWRGTDVAIKFWVSKKHDETDEQGEERLIHEAAVLMRLRHPNILQIFGVLPPPRAIVMERGAQTLAALLAEQPWLPWQRCLELIRGIAAGTEFLHTHTPPIIHGDLKPSNILITAAGTPKIADYGTSFLSQAAKAVRVGSFTIWSPGYAPPEVLCRQPILIPEAVDVFAFGVIITAILGGPKAQSAQQSGTGRSSRTNTSSSAPTIFKTLMQAYAIATYKPFLLNNCPDALTAIVRACCSPSPEDRPCFIMLRGMLDDAAAHVDSWPPRHRQT